MTQIEIVSEEEGQRGWTFRAQVIDQHGALTRYDVTLSWADYNLWSASGTDEPSSVASAVVRFMLARLQPDELAASFDASVARRMFGDADEAIPGLI